MMQIGRQSLGPELSAEVLLEARATRPDLCVYVMHHCSAQPVNVVVRVPVTAAVVPCSLRSKPSRVEHVSLTDFVSR